MFFHTTGKFSCGNSCPIKLQMLKPCRAKKGTWAQLWEGNPSRVPKSKQALYTQNCLWADSDGRFANHQRSNTEQALVTIQTVGWPWLKTDHGVARTFSGAILRSRLWPAARANGPALQSCPPAVSYQGRACPFPMSGSTTQLGA